ncbi:unnamed protein product [Caenorhabditis angaria]|uniref:Serpentine receptor class gamma n=1 Tax=Caenorhabditis angaria TaxID=860376 RepID=A0A9P1IUP6_9PELO|nr:unnamed protein product [Caenorhabditis angaria]
MTNNTCSLLSEGEKFARYGFLAILVLPLTFIYIRILMVMTRKSTSIYTDSFYSIYRIDGVVSVSYNLISYSLIRLIIYITPYCNFIMDMFSTPSWLLTSYFFFYLFFQFMKVLSTVTICANRLTSVTIPVKHTYFWKTYFWHILFLQILISVVCSFPILQGPAYIIFRDGKGTMTIVRNFSFIGPNTLRITLLLPSIVFVMATNILIIKKLPKNMRHVENSMSISTLFISFGFILNLVPVFGIYLIDQNYLNENPTFSAIYSIVYLFCTDFYMISGPIVLLVVDKKLRKRTTTWKKVDSNMIWVQKQTNSRINN